MQHLAPTVRSLVLLGILAQAAAPVSAHAVFKTLFASNNAGAQKGAVDFDLEVKFETSLQALECNLRKDAGTPVALEIYATPDTFRGKERNPDSWRLVATDDGSGVAAGVDAAIRRPTR